MAKHLKYSGNRKRKNYAMTKTKEMDAHEKAVRKFLSSIDAAKKKAKNKARSKNNSMPRITNPSNLTEDQLYSGDTPPFDDSLQP